MVFSSAAFLFVFLPVFIAVYALTPARLRSLTILVGSWAFYAWWRVDFLPLLVGVTAWTWLWGRAVHRLAGPRQRWSLGTAVAGNLGALAYFKYWNFGVENANAVWTAVGGRPLEFTAVLLPIGISFYVFQAISYLVDVYRGDAPPERSFVSFAAFIALFPQLIAGPVLRYKDLAHQFGARTHSMQKVSEGARRFMTGLCMKVLVADHVAPIADLFFSVSTPTLAEAWLGTVAYTVQLYFDFAGYSHMAIGLGLLMGFRFMENFDRPYWSGSITEFWRRWHISLSFWLRDYLYISLGGNRKGRARTSLHLLATMVLGGLWHGAAWTFLLWGAWHGVWLMWERRRRSGLPTGGPGHLLAVARTMGVVMVGWVLFRASSVANALDMLAGLTGLHGLAVRDSLAWRVPPSGLVAMGVGLLVVYFGPWAQQRLSGAGALSLQTRWAPVALSLGFVLAVLRLGAAQHAPFLYFQF